MPGGSAPNRFGRRSRTTLATRIFGAACASVDLVRLYEGWKSSASWRVRWALAHKRVSYDSVWLDIAAGEHLDVLARVNPLCTVPTLELDDGDVIANSVAIIEWLDETYPAAPLLPPQPRARAHVRELVELVHAEIHPLQNTIVRNAVALGERARHAWAARWIERGLGAYEARVRATAGRFSLGDTVTMADLFLVPQVANAARFGADLRGCATVRRIYEASMAIPEAEATQPARAEARALAERARV